MPTGRLPSLRLFSTLLATSPITGRTGVLSEIACLRHYGLLHEKEGTIRREVPMSRFLVSCFAIFVLSAMVHAADDSKSTIRKMNEAWQAAYEAADFDRLASLYTEDAVLMPEGRKPLHGRQAIRNFFAEDFKYVPKRSIILKSLRVEESGSVLVDSGEYRFDGSDSEGKPIRITGNYNTIFKKTDGKWYTAIDIWNVQTPEGSR
jgi:uncharacterized protein (TIGR02246 family)